jgi:hypothetical protein
MKAALGTLGPVELPAPETSLVSDKMVDDLLPSTQSEQSPFESVSTTDDRQSDPSDSAADNLNHAVFDDSTT